MTIPPLQIVKVSDAAQAAVEASARMAAVLRGAIAARGTASAALSGGNTPRDAYKRLAREPDIAWSQVKVFWVDERAVPPADDRSNYAWAKATLLDPAHIPSNHVFRIHAERPDRDAVSREYELALRAHVGPDAAGIPSLDLMVLGVGDDGHTASLFPGEPTVAVADRLVASVAARGSREARITLTAPMIQGAKHVLVLAVGETKCAALQRVFSAEGDTQTTPARVIRSREGDTVWIVDRVAVPS